MTMPATPVKKENTRRMRICDVKAGQRLVDNSRPPRTWEILALEPVVTRQGTTIRVFMVAQDEITRDGIGLFVKKDEIRLRVEIPWQQHVDIKID